MPGLYLFHLAIVCVHFGQHASAVCEVIFIHRVNSSFKFAESMITSHESARSPVSIIRTRSSHKKNIVRNRPTVL